MMRTTELRKNIELNSSMMEIDERFKANVSIQGGLTGVAVLENRVALLAISIKNPRFSNEMVGSFLAFCRDGFSEAWVTIVDKPYEKNLLAAKKSPEWLQAETEKLRRIANETKLRLTRMMGKAANANIKLLDWEVLRDDTPDWLVAEIRNAWNQRGSFYRDIRTQTASVLLEVSDDRIDDYSEFMLEELPVLLQLYYFSGVALVDVYPGPQPDLFWKIESGFYAEEMPELARCMKDAKRLVYLHWMERSAI